jgi:ABC-type multidrug transport system ATPase subunit
MELLQISNLSKYSKEMLVLNGINFSYGSFRRVAISGETGSGKTTLLKVIA